MFFRSFNGISGRATRLVEFGGSLVKFLEALRKGIDRGGRGRAISGDLRGRGGGVNISNRTPRTCVVGGPVSPSGSVPVSVLALPLCDGCRVSRIGGPFAIDFTVGLESSFDTFRLSGASMGSGRDLGEWAVVFCVFPSMSSLNMSDGSLC